MTSRNPARARDPFLRTLRFAASRWRQQWRLALFMSGIVALMAAAELALPLFAGQMVDAMAAPARPHDSAVRDALVALAAIIGFGLALIALRYVLFKTIVRFTLRMMSEVAQDAFRRVQRFSTDWHANSFAGSTVRKVSRGMWAFDLLNDTLLMALCRRCVVLVGATVLLGWHWPLMGAGRRRRRASPMSLVTVELSLDYVAPAARLSNAWDTPHGRRAGRRHELQSGRQGVRRRGPRGRALRPRARANGGRAPGVTWMRATPGRHRAADHPHGAALGRDRPRRAVAVVAGRRPWATSPSC